MAPCFSIEILITQWALKSQISKFFKILRKKRRNFFGSSVVMIPTTNFFQQPVATEPPSSIGALNLDLAGTKISGRFSGYKKIVTNKTI